MAPPPVSPAVIRGRLTTPQPCGLRRGRLIGPLTQADAPALAVIVAPAGSGKSTLLAHVAEAADGPVAWLTLDGLVADAGGLLAHLRAALDPVAPGLRPAWSTAEEAVADVEATLNRPALLILDDLHDLARGPLREVLGLLVEYQPRGLRILLGSRGQPGLDLSRLRLAGQVAEVDADALRFRTWEVDELFRQCHRVRLRPTEVSTLTRRTAGWAAGLQLFHLATHRQPPSGRAALLAGGTPNRLTHEYLTRHVLDRLSAVDRSFLVETSVLDDLTAGRCDALTGRSDSAARLDELERGGLFTFSDGSVYRCHELMRGRLTDELTQRLGADRARYLRRRAARLLEEEGCVVDALRSYCRAEQWDDVRRLLDTGGPSLARSPGRWVELVPESIGDRDPWVLLSLARHLLADGSLTRAAEMYQRAVRQFAQSGAGRPALAELRRVQAWLTPAPGAVSDWVHVARALLTEPRRHLHRLPPGGSVVDDLLAGYAQLVSGELHRADETFAAVGADRELGAPAEAGVLLGRAVVLTLTGGAGVHGNAPVLWEQVQAATGRLGAPIGTRLAHGLQAVTLGDRSTVEFLLAECRRADDRWGWAVLALLAETVLLGTATACADRLAAVEREFEDLAAPTLAVWAAAARTVAAVPNGETLCDASRSRLEQRSRAVGPLPYAVTLLAVAAGHATDGARIRSMAMQTGERCGAGPLVHAIAAALTGPGRPPAGVAAKAAPAVGNPRGDGPAGRGPGVPLRLSCLGGFRIEAGSTPVELGAVRPRHRQLLRLLSVHANRVVHLGHLTEWLWPHRAADRARHSLQVAVSDLRKLLETVPDRYGHSRLRRESSGYRLLLDADDDCDVRRLERRLVLARQALARGDEPAAATHFGRAIAAYRGELLPEDGDAEWVLPERDRLRLEITAACERLAVIRAGQGAHDEAVRLLRYGLTQDRCHDGLWQRLIASLRAGGNPAGAAAAVTAYEQVLAEVARPTDGDVVAGPRAQRLSHR